MLKIAPERPRWRRGCLTNRGGWRDPPGGQLDPSRASYFLCSQSSSVLPPSRLLSHSSSAIPRGRDASSSSRRRAPHSRDSLSNRTHFLSSPPLRLLHPLLVCFSPPPFSNLPSPSRSAPHPWPRRIAPRRWRTSGARARPSSRRTRRPASASPTGEPGRPLPRASRFFCSLPPRPGLTCRRACPGLWLAGWCWRR